MMKLSIIVPSIYPGKWEKLYDGVSSSCRKNSFEVIFVGPSYSNVKKYNVKFVKDFGSPARCLQIASLIAEGEYVTWMPDDIEVERESLDEAISKFDADLSFRDGMTMMYSEGENFSGSQHLQPEYWMAHTHGDLKSLAGVKKDWKIAPAFMYKTSFFYKMGGLDCRFEHINQNTHDLAFSVQELGGKIELSPRRIFKCNWYPDSSRKEYSPILMAFIQNDRPLLNLMYSNVDAAKQRNVQLDNWRNSPSIWSRRFNKDGL